MAEAAAVAILEFINKSGSSLYSTSAGSYMIHIIRPPISACTSTTTACHLAARRVLEWRQVESLNLGTLGPSLTRWARQRNTPSENI